MTIQTQEQIFSPENPSTPQCHASTIAAFAGALYAAWFGGTKEGKDDVGIWLAARENGAWSKPACMARGDVPHWNPVLFPFGDSLFLYFKKGKKIHSWYTCFRVLRHGEWSAPFPLVRGDLGGRGPVKNKPILLRDGTICAPASLELADKPKKGQQWQAFVDLSKDGLNWQAQEIISADADLIQPTVWESGTGLHAFMRSNAGAIYRSDSTDGGHNWCKAYATSLPNNNSGIDAVCHEGRLYVVYNPVSKNWGPRTPLVVSMSEDNGVTWSETITLEDAPGEYSYPAIIAAEGALHVAYTHKRKGIVYAQIEI